MLPKVIVVARKGLIGNLYSSGLVTLAVELNKATRTGVHCTVSGGDDPRIGGDAFDDALLNEISVPGVSCIYIGHSLGADQALRFARKAKLRGIKLPLICPIDPVCWDSDAKVFQPGVWEVDDNVIRVCGFRSISYPGMGRVVRAAGNTVTEISDPQLNVPHAVANPPGGLDIATSPVVHSAIRVAVLTAVAQLDAAA